MITATLGGLIKDYRIKKRLSQFDVSLRIGWRDTSRLSKIEQGRVGKPTGETIEKIIKALGLTEHERGNILLSSGIVPTKEEVKNVIFRLKGDLDNFKYPFLLVDFTWNTLYFNKLCQGLFKLPDKEYRFLKENNPNWLEALFLRKSFSNVQIKAGYTEKNMRPFEEYLISHFKFEHRSNTNEKWFRNLLSKLVQDDLFRKLWSRIPASTEENHLLYNYEINYFTGNWRGKEETLKFHIFAVHPTFDSRFALLLHMPLDEHTTRFYKTKK